MPVTIDNDPLRRRSLVTVPSGSRWTTFVGAVLSALEQKPLTADFNFIIDDQGPMDDVDVAGMVTIGEAMRHATSDAQRRTHTIVVTNDPFFPSWARVIDMHYGNRRHHGAPNLAAAELLMNRLEAA